MPHVGRSDSQRSDSSQRPRVSFNRDVHVKRFGHSNISSPRVVGALAAVGEGQLVALPVRRQRPSRLSRRQLADEARRVLQQADSVTCVSHSPLDTSTLPSRRFGTVPAVRSRRTSRRSLSFREPSRGKGSGSKEGAVSLTDLTEGGSPSAVASPPPVAPPPRRFGSFKRPRVTLSRSVSDAGRSKDATRVSRERLKEIHSDVRERSPSPPVTRPPRNLSKKKSLSDSESACRRDAAERRRQHLTPIVEWGGADATDDGNMLHRPTTLARGRTVDAMVRRLNEESSRAPRRPPRGVSPSALVSPVDDRRHNNNLPFSYTATPTPAGSPTHVIYAEVVSGGGPKHTVHTSVSPPHTHTHRNNLSDDDDEGVGLSMERPDGGGVFQRRHLKTTTDYLVDGGTYRKHVVHESRVENAADGLLLDPSGRGRADGMDARRKDLLTEGHHGRYTDDCADFASSRTRELSSRRDRLESRIESQRKDRFLTSLVDSGRKSWETRAGFDAGYSSRRDFLQSQLDRDVRGRYNELDSGIEVDYRKDSSRIFDDNVKTSDGMTAKIVISSPKSPRVTTKVNLVDVNGRSRTGDGGDETEGGNRYHHHQYTGHSDAFSSTRLVQEQRRTTDVIPASTVLIRHYAAPDDDHLAASDKLLRAERAVAHDDDDDDYERRTTTTRRKRAEEQRDTDEVGTSTESRPAVSDKGSKPVDEKKREAKKASKKRQVSAMEKVKQLFSRGGSDTKTSKKTKKEKKEKGKSKEKDEKTLTRKEEGPEEEDPVTARYTEYRGTALDSDDETVTVTVPSPRHSPHYSPSPSPSASPSPAPRRSQLLQVPVRMSSDTEDQQQVEFVRTRQRLATPSPGPSPGRTLQTSATLTRINQHKHKEQQAGGWFKSLDRLTKKNKTKAKPGKEEPAVTDDETPLYKNNNGSIGSNKNLRFFGDTDQESVTSIPPAMPLQTHRRYKSNSNVANSSNRLHVPRGPGIRNRRHHRSAGDVATSSAESTTEGDSSQQSQRSVVYLHAATVGDIPTPAPRTSSRRAQSREELSSATSSRLQPRTRTVSRSVSVLAPWKPRHYREGLEVNYSKEDNNKNYIKNGKPPKVPASQQTSLNSSTMSRINRRKNAENARQQQKHHIKSTSVESLNRSVKRTPVQDGHHPAKKQLALHPSTSIESLSHRSKDRPISKKNSTLDRSSTEPSAIRNYKTSTPKKGNETSGKKASSKVSRSASMPKDNRVTAGWFKLRNKKQGT